VKRKAKLGAQDRYHHGDLRRHLIEVGERLLEEKGLSGFTLRECAKRAGVSPSAPFHHFGSVTGLLTAIATVSFEGLNEAQETALVGCGGGPRQRVHAIGMAYIHYALAHPARFRVAFGQMPLDRSDPDLLTAGGRSLEILTKEIKALRAETKDSHTAMDIEVSVALAWSAVHGIAQLLIDEYLFVVTPTRDPEAFIGEMVPRMLTLLEGSFITNPTVNRRR
jgi:AcrR family transcriptional regulator